MRRSLGNYQVASYQVANLHACPETILLGMDQVAVGRRGPIIGHNEACHLQEAF